MGVAGWASHFDDAQATMLFLDDVRSDRSIENSCRPIGTEFANVRVAGIDGRRDEKKNDVNESDDARNLRQNEQSDRFSFSSSRTYHVFERS